MRIHPLLTGTLLAIAATILPAHAKTSKVAGERADVLTKSIATFEMRLWPNLGQMEKPFYSLTVRVSGDDAESVVRTPRGNPFARRFPLLKSQAERIIEVLAANGFLDRATQHDPRSLRKANFKEGYVLQVFASDTVMYLEELGWNLSMLHKLDTLRTALDCDAWSAMGLLIDRMSGLRKQWEREAAAAGPKRLTKPATTHPAHGHIGSTSNAAGKGAME